MKPKDIDFIDSDGVPTATTDTFSHVNPYPNPNPHHPNHHVSFGAVKPRVKHVKMVVYVFVGWALASVVCGLIFSSGTSVYTLTIVVDAANSLSFCGASLILWSRLYMSPTERRTFHLVFCSSSANLMSAVIQIGLDFGQQAAFHGACQMGGVAYQLQLMKLFWDTLLSVHVLLLFLAPFRYGTKHHLYQTYFHFVGWGCTAFFALIPLITRSYGIASPDQYVCWLTGASVIYFYFLPFGGCVMSNLAIMAYMTYQLVNPPHVASKDVRISVLVWVMCLALWSTFAYIWFLPYDLRIPGSAWTVPLGQMFTGLNGFVHCLIWLPKIVKSMRKFRQDKLARLGLSSSARPMSHRDSSHGGGSKIQLTSLNPHYQVSPLHSDNHSSRPISEIGIL